MASALPGPTLTAAERDDIVARFGGADEFTAWLTAALADELERRSATVAREAANTAIREAVEVDLAALPVAIVGDKFQKVAVEEVVVDAPAEATKG